MRARIAISLLWLASLFILWQQMRIWSDLAEVLGYNYEQVSPGIMKRTHEDMERWFAWEVGIVTFIALFGIAVSNTNPAPEGESDAAE